MANIVVSNAYLKLDSDNGQSNMIDVSANVRSFSIDWGCDAVDGSAMGDTTKVKMVGIADWSIKASILFDNTAAGQDSKIYNLLRKSFNLEAAWNGSSPGATNPVWEGNGIITGWNPIAGTHGSEAMQEITIEGNGTLVRSES